MKHLKPITLIAMTLALSTACTSQNPKDRLIEKLSDFENEGQYLFAHQDSYFYGHSWNNITTPQAIPPIHSDIYETCKDYPAILGCDLGELELGHSHNLDKVPFESIRQAIKEQHRMGGLTTLSWHARNPVTGGDAWDMSCDSVVRAILPGHSANAKFEGWLDALAEFLLSLTDDKGEQIPIIFRPFHEHTGSWFWWGERLCTPYDYTALWQYTHKYLESKGLTNLLWAYSPAAGQPGYMVKYPGDGYVDILGLDAYHRGGTSTSDFFIDSTNKELKEMSKIAAEKGKLTALTETGAESLPDPAWWTSVLTKTLQGTSACYVLVWRNAWDQEGHFFAPFPRQDSANDFIDFHNLEETVFIQDLNL